MRPLLFFVLIASLSTSSSCVKPRIYKAELAARSAAEAREKVLVKELGDRKTESAALIKEVGGLNRTIGTQENEIGNLRIELSNRTQALGASSNKLANEKADLEKQLANKNILLNKREETLLRIREVQAKRKKMVADIDSAMASIYAPYVETGITISAGK